MKKKARFALVVTVGILLSFAAPRASKAGLCEASCWQDLFTGIICCTTENCFDYCF